MWQLLMIMSEFWTFLEEIVSNDEELTLVGKADNGEDMYQNYKKIRSQMSYY